jgi:hypothetical protein
MSSVPTRVCSLSLMSMDRDTSEVRRVENSRREDLREDLRDAAHSLTDDGMAAFRMLVLS